MRLLEQPFLLRQDPSQARSSATRIASSETLSPAPIGASILLSQRYTKLLELTNATSAVKRADDSTRARSSGAQGTRHRRSRRGRRAALCMTRLSWMAPREGARGPLKLAREAGLPKSRAACPRPPRPRTDSGVAVAVHLQARSRSRGVYVRNAGPAPGHVARQEHRLAAAVALEHLCALPQLSVRQVEVKALEICPVRSAFSDTADCCSFAAREARREIDALWKRRSAEGRVATCKSRHVPGSRAQLADGRVAAGCSAGVGSACTRVSRRYWVTQLEASLLRLSRRALSMQKPAVSTPSRLHPKMSCGERARAQCVRRDEGRRRGKGRGRQAEAKWLSAF